VESRLEDWVFQRDYAERILREQFGVAELTGSASTSTRKHWLPPAPSFTISEKIPRAETALACQ